MEEDCTTPLSKGKNKDNFNFTDAHERIKIRKESTAKDLIPADTIRLQRKTVDFIGDGLNTPKLNIDNTIHPEK